MMTDSVVDLVKHERCVSLVLWQPSAQNILLSAGSDNNVPYDDIVVRAGGEKDVLERGVPQDEAHATLVIHQVHHGVCHCPAGENGDLQ